MAFTEQNKADAYLFFALAFNAAPGKQYGAQIVQAYEAGMTTADIVAQYVGKPDFLKLYPATQTTKEFATALVTNVAAASTSVAAKNAAIADIEKAIAAGWSKDQVIVQILGNLANKPVTDLDWGTTKAQLDNKIAVAKILTEGAKALDTTDAALLQAPLKGVTEDAATVQAALDKSSVLATKLENLAASSKAKAEFAAALDLTGDGKADGLTSATVDAAVTAAVTTKAAAVSTAFGAATTDAGREAALKIVTTGHESAIATAQNTLLTTTATATTAVPPAVPAVTAAEIAQIQALQGSVNSAVTAQKQAYANVAAAGAKVGALGAVPTVTIAGTTVADVAAADKVVFGASINGDVLYDATKKAFVLTPVQETELAALTNTGLKSAITDYLSALNANVTSALVAKAAASAYTTAFATVTAPLTAGVGGKEELAAVTFGPGTNTKVTAAGPVLTATNNLKTAQDAQALSLKKHAEYQAVAATKTKLESLNKAVTDAQKSFTDAKLPLPVEAKVGLIVATAESDTFLPVAETSTISGFNLLGKDSIYVGSSYVLNATGDLAKGDNAKLEVFFKANGADTDVYLEQKVFGSGVNGAAAGNKDIFKITLTGVAADKLTLTDGFVVVA